MNVTDRHTDRRTGRHRVIIELLAAAKNEQNISMLIVPINKSTRTNFAYYIGIDTTKITMELNCDAPQIEPRESADNTNPLLKC